MIFPSLYEELDMERYAQLTINIQPQRNIRIALCDDSGQIVWSGQDESLADFIVNAKRRQYPVSTGGECHYIKEKHKTVDVLCFQLGELAGMSAGELMFYDISDESDGAADAARIVASLCNIAGLVKAELHYLYEVNAMAKELGERYDELSMLRASDLEIIEHRESRHILSTYIRSCAEHLNVDYAAIWISSRQSIYPGGINYNGQLTEVLTLLERISIAAYETFQDGHDGFGINDKDEELRHLIQLPADKKVLLVPVLDGKGVPCGVLTCVNEFYNRDFSNSDKSTLEAVSRKTYKYLQSTRDELTNLLNRKGFEETLWREMAQKHRERYLVLFNIDEFKVINAAYGMATGDIVLASIAAIISKPASEAKFCARLDADVFAVLIEGSEREIESRVAAICNDIGNMVIDHDGKSVSVKARAGVIALNSRETAVADHFYTAELALSNAKEAGDQVVVYHPGNTALLKRKNQLTQVENIKHALEEDRFILYCQRIAPLTDDESHYEILVRMVDEDGELVMPDEFIPVAERYNLMGMVDRWVLENTFKLLRKEEYREMAANFKWGVNLSGVTVGDEDFHNFVSICLHKYNFLPTNLYFEITETAAIKNFQHCVSFMNQIHSLGVQFALDDFGSGLSSFSYLKKLSIDYLKIDGSLVRDIVSSRLDQTMVAAIAEIAKVMNVKTIAEYVENDPIMEVLRELNIDYAQGYGIMKPQPVELVLNQLIADEKCKIYSSK